MNLKSLLAAPLLVAIATTSVSAGKVALPWQISTGDIVTYYETSNKPQAKSNLELQAGNDQFLEDGFPVSIWHGGGSFQGGSFIDVTVTDLDNDNQYELILSSLAAGPLNVINADGTVRQGFPVNGGGVGYVASMDGYIAAAFGGGCNPNCSSYMNLYNNQGTLLWSKPTLGIGVDAAPVMYKQNGLIYIVYEDAGMVHQVDINGVEQPNWPRLFMGHLTTTVTDLDNDGSHEIIISAFLGNGMGKLYLLRSNGTMYAETPSFGVQTRMYPTVGDVDADGQLEIVVIGRNDTSPYKTQMKIFNNDGTLQLSKQVDDNTAYGTQASLADINNDNYPEILFLTNNFTFVMDSQGNNLPGWPKAHEISPLSLTRSNIVVADVVSDGLSAYPEIIFTLYSQLNQGSIMIYNHDGSAVDRWDNSQRYLISIGRSNAVADIDDDGYNEIIIAGNYWDGISGYYPALWAFDLNKRQRPVEHYPVEWGGYSNDSGKSGLYVKPQY